VAGPGHAVILQRPEGGIGVERALKTGYGCRSHVRLRGNDWSVSEKPPARRLPSMGVVPTPTRREEKPAMRNTQQPAKSAPAKTKGSGGFTAEERAAMKDHAEELKAAARRGARATKADGESDVLAKIAEMSEPDRGMAERLHALIKATAPDLSPRTWYGMPAYAKDGNVVCFFQPAEKFKARFGTLGFSDKANLDDGTMWPVYYALTELTAANEARIAALVKQAVS
jgi:uncharacterized protein YdhG (YjbR/CyaY superfamily)